MTEKSKKSEQQELIKKLGKHGVLHASLEFWIVKFLKFQRAKKEKKPNVFYHLQLLGDRIFNLLILTRGGNPSSPHTTRW